VILSEKLVILRPHRACKIGVRHTLFLLEGFSGSLPIIRNHLILADKAAKGFDMEANQFPDIVQKPSAKRAMRMTPIRKVCRLCHRSLSFAIIPNSFFIA
jgi:hypothetical protein